MCLTVLHSKCSSPDMLAGLKPEIAQTNLLVYKSLIRPHALSRSIAGWSPIREFRYLFGKEYETQIDPRIVQSNVGLVAGWVVKVDAGLHSYHTEYKAAWHMPTFPAIIPKGAQYFIGNTGDMVSNRLIVLREQDLEKYDFCEASALPPLKSRHTPYESSTYWWMSLTPLAQKVAWVQAAKRPNGKRIPFEAFKASRSCIERIYTQLYR